MKNFQRTLFCLASLFAANSFADTVSFRATNYVDTAGAPPAREIPAIDCFIDYTQNDLGEFVLNDFSIKILDAELTENDVTVSNFGNADFFLIGGTVTGNSAINSGNDDFYFYYYPSTNEVTSFTFASVEFPSNIFYASSFEFDITAPVVLTLDEEAGYSVPSDGGRLDYDVLLQDFQPGEVLQQWSSITMPNGDEYPVHKLRERQIDGWDGTQEYKRTHLNIPSWFDDGDYTLTWYLINTDTLERHYGTLDFTKGEQVEELRKLNVPNSASPNLHDDAVTTYHRNGKVSQQLRM